MTTQVIILNGGSSSGKSGIARCLQAVLPDPWLAFGTDTLTEAMPASMQSSAAGIQIAPDGEVSIGLEFRALEAAWIKTALAGLQVLWVGVQCEGAVAAGREVARGDRVSGMAASQAEAVHRGVAYDMEVDTTHAESMQCARGSPLVRS